MPQLLKWPLGILLTAWTYMWRTTPMHRSEEPGTLPRDAPPPLARAEGLQTTDDGVGPLFHRVYRARIRDARLSADDVITCIGRDPNVAAPTEFAHFTKVVGEEGELRLGDEFVVRMPGPWDGPVRVVDIRERSFRVATLVGHIEAGQLEYSSGVEGDDVVFMVESWTRSGDRLSELLHERLKMAKEVQLHMWTSFVEQVAKVAGGALRDGIEIRTYRVD